VSNMKSLLKTKIKSGKPSAHDLLIEANENRSKRINKIKFEEKFTRKTYYIENELIEMLNEFAGNEKGEKTKIINEALRTYLETK
jgi:hypothetical protein